MSAPGSDDKVIVYSAPDFADLYACVLRYEAALIKISTIKNQGFVTADVLARRIASRALAVTITHEVNDE